MSLLLDALKKAAEDKKKLSENKGDLANATDEVQVVSEITDDLSLEELENSASTNSNSSETETIVEKAGKKVAGIEKPSSEELTLDDEPVITVTQSTTPINEARHSVSDDALSLLIYKTNSAEKKRKRLFAIGTTVASLLILGLGGAYYYFNLQEGINSLELKHRTAMMRMESKTNRQRPPEKMEIIDNLTANSDIKIEKKVEVVAVDERVFRKEKAPRRNKQIRPFENNRLAENKARLLLIEKTKQADVIGEKLSAAWAAYESASYAEAKLLYQEVVSVEEDNRDALLGLGAIAVIEKDTIAAKKRYINLLKLDPNDPLAIAALTNLRSEDSSPKLSEKYLVSMLEKTPDVAQLNFELGNVYAQQNKWSAAQQSYFKAWQQESENADYIFNLAVSLDQLSQQQQAINFYKDSLLKAKNKQVNFSRETVEKRVNELSGL